MHIAKPAPLTLAALHPATVARFRIVVRCARANGGSTTLRRRPDYLIQIGLVKQVKEGTRGAAGCKARFALTETGEAIAKELTV